MIKYKLDTNRITILCEIYKSEYTYVTLDNGLKRASFCPKYLSFDFESAFDTYTYGTYLPILVFYNQPSLDEVLDKDLPRLEFIVGKTVKE